MKSFVVFVCCTRKILNDILSTSSFSPSPSPSPSPSCHLFLLLFCSFSGMCVCICEYMHVWVWVYMSCMFFAYACLPVCVVLCEEGGWTSAYMHFYSSSCESAYCIFVCWKYVYIKCFLYYFTATVFRFLIKRIMSAQIISWYQ